MREQSVAIPKNPRLSGQAQVYVNEVMNDCLKAHRHTKAIKCHKIFVK